MLLLRCCCLLLLADSENAMEPAPVVVLPFYMTKKIKSHQSHDAMLSSSMRRRSLLNSW